MRTALCFIDTLGTPGGAERLLVELIPELRRLDVAVEVVALYHYEPDIGLRLEEQGFVVHRWRLGSQWSPRGLRRLWETVGTGDYAIYWGHLFMGNLYASMARLFGWRGKTILTFHSVCPTLWWRPLVLLERCIGKVASARVAVSQSLARSYEKFYGWQLRTIYNGVCLPDFLDAFSAADAARTREQHGALPGEFVIVVPSRFTEHKGHKTMLDALRLLRQRHGFRPRLICPGLQVGEEQIARRFNQLADELGVGEQAAFLPAIPQHELLALMKSADLVVVPSLREPFGICAIEALLAKACVILSNVDGLAEIAGGAGDVTTVGPGVAEDLAAKIWNLYQDPAERARLAEAGHRRGQLFSLHECATGWKAAFEEVCRER